ncbi:MAG: hypothetical protein VB111_09645 [Clostridiaceae bacterium]|nr:hypothetical protein [Clostridiaceae bacterium]
MDKKRGVKIATVVVMAVIVLLFGALILSDTLKSRRGTGIVMPDASGMTMTGDSHNPDEDTPAVYEPVTIDPANVKAVVQTLARPSAYTLRAMTEVFSGEDSLSAQVIHAVRGGATSTVRYAANAAGHVVRANGVTYAWQDAGEVVEYTAGDFGQDAAAGLPTYETLYDIPDERILAAAYRQYEGFSCVYFCAADTELGLAVDYYVDIDTGLLVYSETRDASGSVIYTMRTLSIVRDTPGDDAFTLPDGRVVG